MRSEKNILQHELIGLNAEIVSSDNQKNVGIHGKIVDETFHTLNINGKKVFKKAVTLQVKLPTKKVEIDGNLLEFRPWDRIKKNS